MRVLFIGLLVLICKVDCVCAQSTVKKWANQVGDTHFGVNLSASRYRGDLSERYDLEHLQIGWALEGYARYRFHERWCVAADAGLYHVRADQHYTLNEANRLSFSATNVSANLRAQWDMLSIDDNMKNILYAFTGLGVTNLSPCTILDGQSYWLPAFQTEGVRYPLWVAQFSYGLGFPMTLSRWTHLNIEGRYTHVMSDYLDDVSTVYVDKSTASVIEKKLADKRIAEGLPPNPVGATRGNAQKNDGYFLFTLQLIHKF